MHRDGVWLRTDEWAPLVALFVLREGDPPPLAPLSERTTSSGGVDRWNGFNPDVERLHASG